MKDLIIALIFWIAIIVFAVLVWQLVTAIAVFIGFPVWKMRTILLLCCAGIVAKDLM